MVTVPRREEQTQELRPAFRQGIDVQATPEAFGAGIGRAMQGLGQAVGQVADMKAEWDREEAATQSRDSFLKTSEKVIDLQLNPDTGILMKQGKAAIDEAQPFKDALEREISSGRIGLSKAAQKDYDQRAAGLRLSTLEQTQRHVGAQTKEHFLDTKRSMVDTYSRQAEASYRDPNAVARNIEAARGEVAALGGNSGWGAETLAAEQAKVEDQIRGAVFNRSKTLLTNRVEALGSTITSSPGTFDAAVRTFTAEVRASVIPDEQKEIVVDLAKKEFARRAYQIDSAADPAGTAARLGVALPDAAGYGNPSLPAGMRNNNPGNIKFVGQGADRGVVGPSKNTDQGDPQAVFETPEAGMQETYRLALRKYDGGKTTARELIAGNGGWTPGNEQAAENIAASIGINADDDLNLRSPNGAAAFLRALVKQEHGQASDLYSNEMIMGAVTGAAVEPASKPVHRNGPDMPFIARGGGPANMAGVKDIVVDRFRLLQNQYGAVLRINSGHRDEVVNKRAGGANQSQHLSGNALDIDVSKLSKEERIRLIGMASALGFQGIGVYDNALHLDAGSRRAWGPDHHRGSLPAWAEGAIKAHEAGQYARGGRGTMAPEMGGSALASPGAQLDPRFASLSFDDRLELASRSVRDAEARQRDQDAERKRTYDGLVGNFELRTLTGGIASEADILAEPGLLDADRAKLLRTFRTEQGKAATEVTSLRQFLNGDLDGSNAFDSDDRELVNKAYDGFAKTLPKDAAPEQISQATEQFVRQTQLIPAPVQAALVNGSYAGNAQQLAKAMVAATRYAAAAPAAFANMSGGADLLKDTASFTHLVNDRGFSAEQAAARILERRSPDYKVNEDALGKAADKATESLTVADLTGDAFDSISGPGGEPGSGAVTFEGKTLDPGAGNALLVEYREAFREGFITAGGDAGEAKARAVQDLKRTWGVSSVSGTPQMMKLPPERFYPPVNGGHDYIRADAMETAKEFAGEGAEVLGVTLRPFVQPTTMRNLTAEDIRQNRPPRYMLGYVVKRDGIPVYEQVPGTWAMPPERIRAMTEATRAEARAAAYEERGEALDGLNRDPTRMWDGLIRPGEQQFMRAAVEPMAPPAPGVAQAGRAGRYARPQQSPIGGR